MMQFDQRAETYAEHAHVQRQMADWLAEWLPAAAGGRALEYGAGEGMFTRRALPHFNEVHAVDLAPRMVAVGRERAPEAVWTQGDAWRGDGLSSEVDAVLSASLMQWCPDPEAILRRWRNSLRPGVTMLHGFYAAPTLGELHALQGGATLLEWRGVEQWRAALVNAGWTVERMEAQEHSVRYCSALDLLRSLHGVGAVRRGGLRGTRLRRLIREYDQRHALPEGGVYAGWTYCRVLAHG